MAHGQDAGTKPERHNLELRDEQRIQVPFVDWPGTTAIRNLRRLVIVAPTGMD